MHTATPPSLDKKGTWFAILSGFFYGFLGFFGINLINSGFSVSNLTFWRFSFAFLFLLLVFFCRSQRNMGSFRQLFRIMVMGALFYTVPSILFFIASGYIGTGQSMVIFFTFPIFVMLLNWVFLKQPLKPHYFLSFALTLVGLIFLVDMGEVGFDLIGVLLSLIAALFYGIYIFLSKKTSLPALSSSLMVTLGCLLTSGTMAVAEGSFLWPTLFEQWVHIVGLALVCSVLPILLMFESVKYISSEKASLLSVLEPVFVVIFGVILLGEQLKINTILGIILTLAGAMTVTINWQGHWLTKLKFAIHGKS